jgi:O-acetyl-ADP-ribose deacetylase (regulator of RNase III)
MPVSDKVSMNGVLMRLKLGDITLENVDAIVNAANSSLMGGGGVDGAIHRAGGPAILEECKKTVTRQGPLPTGMAVITTGGNLPARHVIHTVGPVWQGGKNNEPALLASAYRESLKLAVENGMATVAFPSISTGVYGYPVDKAAIVALNTVVKFLKDEPGTIKEVTFVLFDGRTMEAYREALKSLAIR